MSEYSLAAQLREALKPRLGTPPSADDLIRDSIARTTLPYRIPSCS